VGILASLLLAAAARNVVDPKAVSAWTAQSLNGPRESRFVADRVVLAVVAADSDFLRVRSG